MLNAIFSGTPLQRWATHLKRHLLSSVRNGDKGEQVEDLRQVFRTRERSYMVERVRKQWLVFYEKWGELSQFRTTGGGFGLQGLLHLSELRNKDSVDDLHDELD